MVIDVDGPTILNFCSGRVDCLSDLAAPLTLFGVPLDRALRIAADLARRRQELGEGGRQRAGIRIGLVIRVAVRARDPESVVAACAEPEFASGYAKGSSSKNFSVASRKTDLIFCHEVASSL